MLYLSGICRNISNSMNAAGHGMIEAYRFRISMVFIESAVEKAIETKLMPNLIVIRGISGNRNMGFPYEPNPPKLLDVRGAEAGKVKAK